VTAHCSESPKVRTGRPCVRFQRSIRRSVIVKKFCPPAEKSGLHQNSWVNRAWGGAFSKAWQGKRMS
jgi:hypothetical protein